MAWENLYPACDQCNSGSKQTKYSCALLRPDVDPVEEWIEFHAETGELAPAPSLDRRTRARVRLTLRVFGLNTNDRCLTRRGRLRDLRNAAKAGDMEQVEEAVKYGPYRYATKVFAASLTQRPSSP